MAGHSSLPTSSNVISIVFCVALLEFLTDPEMVFAPEAIERFPPAEGRNPYVDEDNKHEDKSRKKHPARGHDEHAALFLRCQEPSPHRILGNSLYPTRLRTGLASTEQALQEGGGTVL